MKKLSILSLAAGMLALASCDSYLDKLPDDRAEVNTLDKAKKFLVSAYPNHSPNFVFYMSGDNVTDNITVDADGHVTSYMADVDTDPDYAPDTEVVTDGYLAESTARSAPYFQLQIDGIKLLDTNFGG